MFKQNFKALEELEKGNHTEKIQKGLRFHEVHKPREGKTDIKLEGLNFTSMYKLGIRKKKTEDDYVVEFVLQRKLNDSSDFTFKQSLFVLFNIFFRRGKKRPCLAKRLPGNQ